MMISTRGRYALRILIDFAEQQTDGYVTLKSVAERQEISEKYLESIAKDLVRAGFLEGVRGKGGGYRLAAPPEQIGVYDVLCHMEGTLAPVACMDQQVRPCSRMSRCRTLPLWKGLDDVVREYLSGYSIRDLMHRESDGFDYVI